MTVAQIKSATIICNALSLQAEHIVWFTEIGSEGAILKIELTEGAKRFLIARDGGWDER